MTTEKTSHVQGYRTYVIVWASLLVLTVVTWLVSFLQLGLWNMTVAMVIASLKASLVALFFMHLRYENRLVWIFALTPLGFLALIVAGTLADVLLR